MSPPPKFKKYPINQTTEFLREYCDQLGYDIGDHHEPNVRSIFDDEQFYAISKRCVVLDRARQELNEITLGGVINEPECLVYDPDVVSVLGDMASDAGAHLAEPVTAFSIGLIVALAICYPFIGRRS